MTAEPQRCYIITESDVAKLEYHNPYGWGSDIAKRCRSNPIHHQSEREIREKVLDKIVRVIEYNEDLFQYVGDTVLKEKVVAYRYLIDEAIPELRKQGEQP